MNTPIQKIENDLSHLAVHARALLAATADAAEDHVKEARSSLAEVLDSGKSLANRFHDQATARTRACDLAIHENPYLVIGAAMGLGALLGYLATRECVHGRCANRRN
ncbi:hypothetical protein N9C66_04820 [Akkermansiaceae bacterium]|nr:hypothetical protein [Akkermansiaceae bacterium]MDA7886782.1 hypothetical protein [bacterium]MDA7891292.1 hypothetical protein [Akkermansiaceae bacterium]MDA7908236.1 hypothetical protein [Akkermansiaceae bacterium]MDA7929371.1 hypothetical protein [Akkermansiaceae bacterium]